MNYLISALTNQYSTDIQKRIDLKTKPLGALGKLEPLALQLADIQSHKYGQLATHIRIIKPSLVVFAADHGIAEHGISIAPSEVTQQMVANFVVGGAAVNVFCKQFGWDFEVVDAGMLAPPPPELKVTSSRLGNGTKDISKSAAMTIAQVHQGFEFSKKLVERKVAAGCNLLAFGEMGIGNTSSAAAIMAAVLGLDAKTCVGAGTGIDAETLQRKTLLIQQALNIHPVTPEQPIDLLAQLGGFEIVHICGSILAAAELGVPVVVDGFICTAAAMIANLINSSVVDYLIFAHCSNEQGHKSMLDWFNVVALLQLDMRLGEGSGAALSLPIIKAACAFYNNMASFNEANIESVVS